MKNRSKIVRCVPTGKKRLVIVNGYVPEQRTFFTEIKSVFKSNGRQYIVIACGGGKLNTRSGDSYVAFALPENK